MARVTVEDCLDKVENRFELVLLAAHRARWLSQGASITVPRDNDKNPVVALRELAEQTLSADDVKEQMIHSLQRYVEVDEPEAQPLRIETAAENSSRENDQQHDSPVAFDQMNEDDLLAGIKGLVAPEKSDDF